MAGTTSTSAAAASTGYGEGGYGEGSYGGDDKEEETPPTVATVVATDVTYDSATLSGELQELGDASSVDVYFQYRRAGASDWNRTGSQTLSTPETFEAMITNLDDGSDYEFRAVGETDAHRSTGETLAFTTDIDAAPAVTTVGTTDLTDGSATLHGEVEDLGSASSVDAYFEVRPTGTSQWNPTGGDTLTSPAAFETTVTGLDDDTDYEYRAVAESERHRSTGETLAFTTEAASTADPVVDRLDGRETSPPNPHATVEVEWAISHADGELASVAIDVTAREDATSDSWRTAVSGSEESGTQTFDFKHGSRKTYDVALTVTDTDGTDTTKTTTVHA